jgi:hypothetical protein
MSNTQGLPRPTLNNLRRQAPRRDRGGDALASPRPCYSARFARSIDELRERCGRYGDWAVIIARYEAVTLWMMQPEPVSLTHDGGVAAESVILCKEEIRFATGLPDPDGNPVRPVMHRISHESRQEARDVAAATMRDWEAAGAPYLTPNRITSTHQYILACQKAKRSENRA